MKDDRKRVLGAAILDQFLARLLAITESEFDVFELANPSIRKAIASIKLVTAVEKDDVLLISELTDMWATMSILLEATAIEWPERTGNYNWVGIHRVWIEFVARFCPKPKSLPAHLEELVAA